MKRTNSKYVAMHLAKEAGLFLCKPGSVCCIKLSSVDKDYYELSELEVIARFDEWDHVIYWLKGYLMGRRDEVQV